MKRSTEELRTEDGIEAFLAFANPILGVDMNDPYMRELYGTSRLVSDILEEARAGFVIRDGGKIVAGLFTTILDDRDKADRRISDSRTLALTEYWAVAEDRRRQGLISTLIRASAAWARSRLAVELLAEIELTNPPSLRTAFRNGFVATDLLPPGLGIPGEFLVLRKPL